MWDTRSEEAHTFSLKGLTQYRICLGCYPRRADTNDPGPGLQEGDPGYNGNAIRIWRDEPSEAKIH